MRCRLSDCGFDFSMIGGSTEKITFEAISEYSNVADLSGCTDTFSICRYDERYEGASINIADTILSGNTVVVNFSPDDTIDLYGKYIWQLSIYSPELGKLAVAQGNVVILKNIDTRIVGE